MCANGSQPFGPELALITGQMSPSSRNRGLRGILEEEFNGASSAWILESTLGGHAERIANGAGLSFLERLAKRISSRRELKAPGSSPGGTE